MVSLSAGSQVVTDCKRYESNAVSVHAQDHAEVSIYLNNNNEQQNATLDSSQEDLQNAALAAYFDHLYLLASKQTTKLKLKKHHKIKKTRSRFQEKIKTNSLTQPSELTASYNDCEESKADDTISQPLFSLHVERSGNEKDAVVDVPIVAAAVVGVRQFGLWNNETDDDAPVLNDSAPSSVCDADDNRIKTLKDVVMSPMTKHKIEQSVSNIFNRLYDGSSDINCRQVSNSFDQICDESESGSNVAIKLKKPRRKLRSLSDCLSNSFGANSYCSSICDVCESSSSLFNTSDDQSPITRHTEQHSNATQFPVGLFAHLSDFGSNENSTTHGRQNLSVNSCHRFNPSVQSVSSATNRVATSDDTDEIVNTTKVNNTQKNNCLFNQIENNDFDEIVNTTKVNNTQKNNCLFNNQIEHINNQCRFITESRSIATNVKLTTSSVVCCTNQSETLGNTDTSECCEDSELPDTSADHSLVICSMKEKADCSTRLSTLGLTGLEKENTRHSNEVDLNDTFDNRVTGLSTRTDKLQHKAGCGREHDYMKILLDKRFARKLPVKVDGKASNCIDSDLSFSNTVGNAGLEKPLTRSSLKRLTSCVDQICNDLAEHSQVGSKLLAVHDKQSLVHDEVSEFSFGVNQDVKLNLSVETDTSRLRTDQIIIVPNLSLTETCSSQNVCSDDRRTLCDYLMLMKGKGDNSVSADSKEDCGGEDSLSCTGFKEVNSVVTDDNSNDSGVTSSNVDKSFDASRYLDRAMGLRSGTKVFHTKKPRPYNRRVANISNNSKNTRINNDQITTLQKRIKFKRKRRLDWSDRRVVKRLRHSQVNEVDQTNQPAKIKTSQTSLAGNKTLISKSFRTNDKKKSCRFGAKRSRHWRKTREINFSNTHSFARIVQTTKNHKKKVKIPSSKRTKTKCPQRKEKIRLEQSVLKHHEKVQSGTEISDPFAHLCLLEQKAVDIDMGDMEKLLANKQAIGHTSTVVFTSQNRLVPWHPGGVWHAIVTHK